MLIVWINMTYFKCEFYFKLFLRKRDNDKTNIKIGILKYSKSMVSYSSELNATQQKQNIY